MDAPSSRRQALFVGSDLYRRAAFGRNHPLSIARVEKVTDLCRALNWFDKGQFIQSPPATRVQLEWFHDPAYLDALQQSDQLGAVSAGHRLTYGFGTMENPLFAGVFERAATSVGGSILAAELALEGRIVFHPAGGTHHALYNRARGFCYFNDPVFAVLRFLRAGLTRVLYIDLDAHHGDGVEQAFANDDRVRTISVHEAGRWPNTGGVADVGAGFACNIPMPANCNDSELNYVNERLLLPLAMSFEPEAVVMTCGADACAGDPLSTMQLSNRSLWLVIDQLTDCAPKVVIVGGGGYNPWTLIRYWAGLWGTVAGKPNQGMLPDNARQVLEGLSCDLVDDEDIDPNWLSRLTDPPNVGPIRDNTGQLVERVRAAMIDQHWQAKAIPKEKSMV